MSDLQRHPRPDDFPPSCDWGDCDREGADWRWSRTHGWLPVCAEHMEQSRRYGRHLQAVTSKLPGQIDEELQHLSDAEQREYRRQQQSVIDARNTGQ